MSEKNRAEAVNRRLEDLEIKVVYQDRLIDELNDVVHAFASRVEALEASLKKLQANTESGPDIDPTHQKPPHY